MSAAPEVVREPHSEIAGARVQLRILQIMLSLAMLFDAYEPAILILQVPESMMHKVAVMGGNQELIATMFILAGLAMLPHALMHVFFPQATARRQITKMACLGLALMSISWALMAWLSHNIDAPALTGVMVRQSIGAIGYALALALALNTELAQRHLGVHP
jgi:hypothetical protein